MVGDEVITGAWSPRRTRRADFNGFYIQTEGTGGAPDATPGAVRRHLRVRLDVRRPGRDRRLRRGDRHGQRVQRPDRDHARRPTASRCWPSGRGDQGHPTVAYPATDAGREALEGMLIEPQGDFTVTDNFSLNNFGEIGLAAGTETLKQPTDVAPPLEQRRRQHRVQRSAWPRTRRRGSRWTTARRSNYLGNATNKAIPLPWLTARQADPGRSTGRRSPSR